MLRRLVGQIFALGRQPAAPPPERRPLERDLADALESLAKGDAAAAESKLRAVAAREPNAAAPHALLANLLHAQRRDGARAAYERALALDPAQPELRLGYAGLLAGAGAYEDADREFQRVIDERPDWAHACVNFGVHKLQRAQFHDAIALLERAVALAPDLVAAHVNLSHALQQVPLRERALAHARRALELDPSNAAALKNAAALSCDIGDSEAARAYLQARADQGVAGARIAKALTLPGVVDSRAHIAAIRETLAHDLAGLERADIEVSDPASEIGVIAGLAYHGEDDRALLEAIARVHLRACPGLASVAPHCREPAPPR